jgi:hypothetical protein
MNILEFDDLQLSADLMRGAVELLPLASPATLNRNEQQHELGVFSGLASRATALMLEAGRPASEALRVLEIGRGVIAASQLDLRSDLQDVMQADEKLANRFRLLRDMLKVTPTSLLESKPTWENRHAIWDELQEVMQKIRQLPKCTHFGDALMAEEMLKLAKEGPIVILNTDSIRNDAFLVTSESIRSIRLLELDCKELKRYASFIRQVEGDNRFKKTATVYGSSAISLPSVLGWLWDSVVKQVFAELGINGPLPPGGQKNDTQSEKYRPQRIWWVTSGLLSILPLHAAGCHDLGNTTNALDMVVSSYAPTVKSIWHARQKAVGQSPPRAQQALLVALEETPGQRSLPGAKREVNSIDKWLPATIHRHVAQQPTKEKIISALQQYQICHFACHGHADSTNPSNSGLYLLDSDSPLTVSAIAQLDLSQAQLAYLSACPAADHRIEALLDEYINVAAAFLLAGFPTVVGTLWPIRDQVSADLARDFYKGILAPFQGDCNLEHAMMDISRSAVSLNLAVRCLREKVRGKRHATYI